MKTIRLRKIRKAFRFNHLAKSVIVTSIKTGKLQEFPSLREAIGFAVCELFGFGTGCRYYQNRIDRLNQKALRMKLKGLLILSMTLPLFASAQIHPVLTAETQLTTNGNLNHSILAGINTYKDDQIQIGYVHGKAPGFALNAVLQATDLLIIEIQHQSLKYKGEFDRKSTIAGLFGVKHRGMKFAFGGILGDYDTKRDFSEGIGVIGKVGYSVKF